MTELLIDTFWGFWNTLCEMAPYLLFGFFVAGILSVFVSTRLVERHLGGKKIGSIFKASLFGVPLPLCSCGVIPVAASLKKRGASRAATTAFLLSTPQTGVDSIMITFSLLGPVVALFRPLAALVTGFVGGGLVAAFGEQDEPAQPDAPQAACGTNERPHGFIKAMGAAMRYGFGVLPRDLAKAMLAGLLVAGLIGALVPADSLAAYGSGPFAMIAVMAVAIPLYVCATASVPIAAAMLASGVSYGVVLVFLIAGPATNAATVATIWKVMGRKTTMIYLGTVAVCALATGLLLDYTMDVSGIAEAHQGHSLLPDLLNSASAVVLLIILAAGLVKPSGKTGELKADKDADLLQVEVGGMTCESCAKTVQAALAESKGVTGAVVDLDGGFATVSGTEYDIDSILSAIEDLGYKVKGTSNRKGDEQ